MIPSPSSTSQGNPTSVLNPRNNSINHVKTNINFNISTRTPMTTINSYALIAPKYLSFQRRKGLDIAENVTMYYAHIVLELKLLGWIRIGSKEN